MKVYFSDHIFSSQRYGGVSRIFAEIIPRLQKLKIDVGYLGRTHINDYFAPPPQTPSSHVPWMPRLFRRFSNDLIEKYFLKIRRPDIVHVTYYPTQSRTRRYSKTKIAVTVYDMIHERLPHKVNSHDPTPLHKKEICQKADLIFAISEHTKKDLIELYQLPKEKIVVTHLASSLVPLSSLDQEKKLNEKTQTQKPFFLYVGTRAGYKNFSIGLRAFARLVKTDSTLEKHELICFGGPEFQPEELADIQTLSLMERVHHCGGGDDVLTKYYQEAIALVYPSLYEGFGIPPLEAMGQGCPVIVSTSSSLPEVVGSAGILFDPLNEDALLTAMKNIVSSPSLRNDLIKLGFQQEARFSWDKTAEQTLAGYRLIF